MRRVLLAAAVVLSALAAPVAHGQLPGGYTWQYFWGDDFSGDALDTTKWLAGEPGWANSSQSLANPDGSLVAVGDGNLVLTAERNSVGFGYEKNWDGGVVSTYPFGSYGLQTPIFAPGSGSIFFEARIKLPESPGSWPAFWGLDPNAATGNELDIMEYPLNFPGGSGYADNQYHTAYHYSNYSGAGGGQVTTGSALNNGGYHVFSALWDRPAQTIRWYLDGVQVKSYTNATVDQMDDIYAILNYAVGGNPDTWIGRPTVGDWGVAWTDQTEVDWIRVWKSSAAKTSNWAYTGTATDVFWDDNANWSNGSPNLGGVTSNFNTIATAAQQRIQWPGRRTTSVMNFDGSTSYQIGFGVFGSGQYDRLALVYGDNGNIRPTINVAATSTAAHSIASELEFAGGLSINNDSSQAFTLGAQVLGDGGININGQGVVIFEGNNTYGGNTIIDSGAAGSGVARVRGQNSLGIGGTVIIGEAGNATTARLEMENNSLLSNNIDLRGRNNSSVGIQSLSGDNTISGTITANVGGSTYQIQSDAGTLTLSGAASGATASGVALQAASGSRVFTLQGAGNGIVSGKIQNGGGTVGITKAGAGTWTFSGANTYTGATNVNAGTLGFTSAPSTIGSVAVANGANLRVRAAGAGTTTLNSSSLTLGSSTLTLDFASLDTTAPLISTTGAFTLNGAASFAFQNAAVLSTGSHALVSYSSFGGGGSLPGSVLSVGPRGTGMLVNAGNTLSLDVLTNDRPIWTGGVSGAWSTGGPDNWKLQSNSAATAYLEGDNVLFDDSATGTTSITINSGNITPAAVTFNNSTKNYTISGTNGIAGSGWLTKSGTGTVTLNTANTFTGAVTIDGGTLFANPGNAASNRAFSFVSGITVNNGGTLRAGANGLFGWDGTQVKPITVNSGGLLTIDGTGNDVNVGTVILNGGTLAGGPSPDWGSWNFGRAAGVNPGSGKLVATENSTVTATNVLFRNGAFIDVASGKTLTFSGTITDGNNEGVSSLVKSGGTGTLVLSGANSYTGTTTINAGTVSISANNNLGANGTGVTLDGGTLQTTALIQNTNHKITVLGGGGTINVSNNVQYWISSIAHLQGYGPLTVTGDGTLTQNKGNLRLSQINDGYSGVLTVKDGGSLEFGANQAISTFASLVVGNQGEVGVATGLTLPNPVTVTGNTNSVLSFINGNAGVFSGPIALNGGSNLTVGLRDWYNYGNTRSGTISGVISGSGGLSVNNGTGSGGVLTLSAINTYTGGTTVNGGTLSVGAGGAVGGIRGTLTVNSGATVQLNAVDALGYNSDAEAVTQIHVNGGTLNNNVNGNNGYLASWALTGGSMTSTGGGAFHINAGAGKSITSNASANSSTISGNIAIRGANSNLGINVGNGAAATDLLISGAITNDPFVAGNNRITKTGAGTLVLSGNNTYTGTTTVDAGTLLIAGSGSIGNGAVAIASGAAIGGDGTIGGSLSVNLGAKFVFSLTDTLTVNGASVTFGGFGVSDLTGLTNAAPNGTYTLIDGLATINPANISNVGAGNAFNLGNGKSAFFQLGSLDLVVVPEPGTLALVALGLGGLLAGWRVRRHSA